MVWQNTPYSLPLAASAVGAFLLAVFILRRRHTPGAVPFSLVLVAVAEWNASYALQMASVTFAAKLVFSNLLYIGVVCVPGLWLLFALEYTGRIERPSARTCLLLAIEPLLIIALTWTDSHGIFRTVALDESGALSVLAVKYGPLFWVHATYSYLLLLMGALLLGQVLFRTSLLYRHQSRTVLVGVLAPWIGNALYISGLSPFPNLDLTPFGFIVLGAAVGFGLFRYQLLDIPPIAREAVIEDLGDGIIVLDPRDTVADVNPAALSMLNMASEPVVGLPLAEAFAGTPRLLNAIAGAGETPSELRLDDGSEAPVYELHFSQLHDRERLAGHLVLLRNVTARKRADAELVRTQRLRAVGELSLGVSHNLNNILTGVMGPAGLIKHMTGDRDILHEVEVIIRSATLASELVERLGRTVHVGDDDALQAVSISEAVSGAITAARPRWKDETEARNAEIEVTAHVDGVPAVMASRAGLHDVLLNLLFNAIDALPDGGRIRIAAEKQGDEVVLTVADNGVGMDPDVAARVFEPFFTTKMDIGSGLGLSTAYAEVGQWGGSMHLRSNPGEGSVFELRIPLWSGESGESGAAAEDDPMDSAQSGAGSRPGILVVEDDEAVRSFLARVLSTGGRPCELAGSGKEALERFAAGRYQVAIIDLGMPGMSGDALARALREIDARIVTVLSTGWMLREDDARLQGFDLRIAKPFRVDEIELLLDKAARLYDSRQAGN